MSNKRKTVLKLLGSLLVVFCLVLAGCGDAKQAENTANEASSTTKAPSADKQQPKEQQPKEQASANRAPGFEEKDVELGGIRIGMSYDEVIKLKGKPTKEEKSNVQLVRNVIFYGHNVEIGFSKEKVRYVTVSADNDWRTPTGLHVGMPLNVAETMYGPYYKTMSAPTNRPESSKNSPFYEDHWQGTRYRYRCTPSDVYSYKPGDTFGEMWITSGQTNNIDSITIREIIPES